MYHYILLGSTATVMHMLVIDLTKKCCITELTGSECSGERKREGVREEVRERRGGREK